MMFDWLYDTTTKQAAPARGNSVVAPYFKKYGDISEQLLVCLDFPRYYRDLVTRGTWLEQEYLDAYRTLLREYKTRFPKMEFLEVGNEPDATQWTPLQTYEMYQKVCALVAPLNAEIAADRLPGPSLKMGGPTLYKLDDTQVSKWLSPFLALYAADASPTKRLDFISYHQYLMRESTTTQPPEIFKTQPARAAQDRRLIDTALAENGLTPGVPVMVTEGGFMPPPSLIRCRNQIISSKPRGNWPWITPF